MSGYAPMLDEALGVYTFDRGWVHLVVAVGLVIVVMAVALAIASAASARSARGLYREGLRDGWLDMRQEFRKWRDGYFAASADTASIDLIETVGTDLFGVYDPRPTAIDTKE